MASDKSAVCWPVPLIIAADNKVYVDFQNNFSRLVKNLGSSGEGKSWSGGGGVLELRTFN